MNTLIQIAINLAWVVVGATVIGVVVYFMVTARSGR